MKFVCDRCQTRYSIADEKVRQKILRIRCKTCGNVIVVQDDAGRTTVAAQPPELVRPTVAGGHPPAVPGSHKAAPASGPKSSPATRGAGPGSVPLPRAAKGKDRLGGHAEWHVAIDGVQSGPLARAEIAKRIVAAGTGREILVWKEGMATWKTPREVSVIARELSHLQPASVSPPPRPSGGTPAPVTHAIPPAKPATLPKSVPRHSPPKAAEPGPEADDFDQAEPAATIIDDTFTNEVTTQKSGGAGGLASSAGVDFADEALREVTTRKGKTLNDSGSLYTPDLILSEGAPTPPPVEPLPPVVAKPAAAPLARASAGHAAVTSSPTRTPAPHSAVATVRPSASHPAVTAVPMPTRTPPPFSGPSARSSASHAAMPALPSLAPPALRPSASFAAVPAMRTPPPQAGPARISAPHPAVTTAALASVPPMAPPGMATSPVPATFVPPVSPLVIPGATPPPPGATFGSPVPPTPLPTPIPIDVSAFDLGASSPAADLVVTPGVPSAGLFQRQPGLKYVVAALAIVALIILLGLVILRSEREKPIDPVAAAEAERAKADPLKVDPPKADPPKADPLKADPPKADPPKAEAPKETRPAPTERPAPLAVLDEKPATTGGKRGSHRGGRSGGTPHERASRDKTDPRPPRLTGARPNPFDENKGVSQSQIMGVVRDTGNQSALRACYERALKMDTRLTSGRIDVTVSISMGGAVQRVVINAPSSFILVEPCIKAAVKRWHFPSNTEDYGTSFPLIMQGGM